MRGRTSSRRRPAICSILVLSGGVDKGSALETALFFLSGGGRGALREILEISAIFIELSKLSCINYLFKLLNLSNYIFIYTSG